MSQTNKRKNKHIREQKDTPCRHHATGESLNQEILDSIGSPNSWTPEVEDIWIKELQKLSSGEIYKRFPPIKKPPNVRKRPKGSGWGDKIIP